MKRNLTPDDNCIAVIFFIQIFEGVSNNQILKQELKEEFESCEGREVLETIYQDGNNDRLIESIKDLMELHLKDKTDQEFKEIIQSDQIQF